MKLIATGLLATAAFVLTAFAGPEPRDITTNKPSPERCAAAERLGQTLPGCAGQNEEAEVDSAQPTNPAVPREQYMVCPGNPRCPR